MQALIPSHRAGRRHDRPQTRVPLGKGKGHGFHAGARDGSVGPWAQPSSRCAGMYLPLPSVLLHSVALYI